MPELTEIKILPYGAESIYDLVMDIEKYSEFLPWCKKAKIVENISENNVLADLVINFKAFSERYRSDVKFYQDQDGSYIVESKAISGPFRDLDNKWKISAIKDENGVESAHVEFHVSFSFNSFLLEKMIGAIFTKASHKMINSFEERAKELFG